MSIKGFIVNGSTQKYDYNELDNKPVIPSGGGVSEELKEALLQLAEKIAYVDANGEDYYQDLYDALYSDPTYSVTNNLTDVTNSNAATRVTQGNSYSATLTATSGYTINSVQITMGGNDVTGTSYSGGTITIANVTGNIVITAVATERQATLVSIDAVFTQGQAVIYDTDSLDTLKQYLVVTAYYDDTTSEVLSSSAYTLSGTLTTGTSTITAAYGGESDTFTVTVTHADVPSGYTKYDYITITAVSAGTQAKAYSIWTGIQLSTDYTFEMKLFVPTGITPNQTAVPLVGTRGGASGTKEFALFYKYALARTGYWINGTDTSNTNVLCTTKGSVGTIKVLPVGKSQTYPTKITINVDGTDYDSGSTSTEVTFDSWFGIFNYAISATAMSNNDSFNMGHQIGEIIVTDSNDSIVYDLIPCKDSNNRYGFYENVNHNFYYNSTYATTAYSGGYWT